jgi:Patatin-like phospholipase
MVPAKTSALEGGINVRFGSKADVELARPDIRFIPSPATTCEEGRKRHRLVAAQHSTSRRLAVPQTRTPFEQIALLLQGGGALGAYQAGVYEALAEADLHPDWVAGISIGAINSAIIAGNPPKRRVDALREPLWTTQHEINEPPVHRIALISAVAASIRVEVAAHSWW